MEQTFVAAHPLRSLERSTYRIASIDFLRGLVMVIMALDHTRDFFHDKAMVEDPLNMATTSPILFFTRWITHFCAPVFVFLAGTSAWFQSLRKTKKELSLFLIKRGLWLIVIEITIINLIFSFDIYFSTIALTTIWAIGISMLILGLVIWLPFTAIVIIGALIVLGHNSLDFYEAGRRGEQLGFMYDLSHRVNLHSLGGNVNLLILYPFLPWAGLMMLGYSFGKIFTRFEGAERKKILTWLGLSVTLLFIILRAINVYGNPADWKEQKNALFTILSFIDTHKYPPSLLFMCMTIGPAILFLAFIGNLKNRFANFITVYGKVPFFYYILHFFLIHILATIFYLANGHSFMEGWNADAFIKFVIPGKGVSIGVVYLIWIFVVVSLYPLCKWFSDYKRTHNQWWLSYL